MTVIELLEVGVHRPRGPSPAGVSVAVAEGERVALLGLAGSGKTALLEVAAGVTTPDAGVARVLGRPARPPSSRRAWAPAADSAWGGMTPLQVVRRAGQAAGGRSGAGTEVLDLVRLAHAADRPADELSAGERAALAVAAALASCPAALLMDSVTAALSEPVARDLWAYIDHRRAHGGLAVLHAAAGSAEAEQADRVVLMRSGTAVAQGPPDRLLEEWAADEVTVEADDPRAARAAADAMAEVRVVETPHGVRITCADSAAVAARLLRHEGVGVRVVCVRRPTLWDVLERLGG